MNAARPFFTALLSGFLLAAVVVLTGCNGDDAASDAETVITFWHFWSEPGQKAALQKRIDAFEQQNPGIRVKLTELTWNDGKAKLQTAFGSQTAPDLLELGSDWIAEFSSAGVLANQSGMVGDSAGRFSDEVLAPGRLDGNIYAWPWVIGTRVLFCNKALLARAGVDTSARPATWADVLVQAEAVQALGEDIYGVGINGPDAHRLYKKIIPFFWSNGGRVLNDQGQPVINSPENIEALEAYLELARAGVVETQRQLDEMFLRGKVGFWISGPWLVDRIAADNPDLNYTMVLLPSFGGKPAVSFGGGEYLAINQASERKTDAKKLITFLTSPEQALAFCREIPGGMIPADLSAAADPFLQEPKRRIFVEQMASARMTPVHDKWLDIEAIVEDEVSRALLGEKEAAEALEQAQARIGDLLSGGEGMPAS